MSGKTKRLKFDNKRLFLIPVCLSIIVILFFSFTLRFNYGVRLLVDTDGKIRFYSDTYDSRTVNNNFPTRTPTPTLSMRFDKNAIQKDINMMLNIKKIPEFNIDTTNWIDYYDTNTKMRFKYPRQWGEPISKINTHYDEMSSGSYFSLQFSSNKDINIDGVSEDYGVPRGFHSFSGFIERSKRGRTPKEFCESQKEYFLYCYTYDNAVLALTGKESCYNLAWFYEMYNLNYYLDFPDEYVIDGVQFKADFLSDKYRDLINGYSCNDAPNKNIDNSIEFHRTFNQALLDRRLDEESMSKYDILIKFYETIEVQ